MLNTIVDISLRYKVLVLVGFLLVVVFGVQAFRTVPVDAFPDVTPVQVNIYTCLLYTSDAADERF